MTRCFVDAMNIAIVALRRLTGDTSANPEVERMVSALENRKAKGAHRRERIKEIIRQYTPIKPASERDDVAKRSMHERFLKHQTLNLIVALGSIDKSLELEYETARNLVDRFGYQKNGAAKLAANWVWKAGLEHGGVPQRGSAPKTFVERYQQDPAKKRAKRSHRIPR